MLAQFLLEGFAACAKNGLRRIGRGIQIPDDFIDRPPLAYRNISDPDPIERSAPERLLMAFALTVDAATGTTLGAEVPPQNRADSGFPVCRSPMDAARATATQPPGASRS